MPGMRCTVGVCNNSRINVGKCGKQISFYRFPKEKDNREMWIQRCARGGQWNFENCRVCSDHFKAEDYEHDVHAELLGLPPKKKLKITAVPSLKLSKDSISTRTENTEPNKRLSNKTNKILMKSVLETENPVENKEISTTLAPVTPAIISSPPESCQIHENFQ